MALHGLKRIPLIPNKEYKRSGLASYANLMRKYKFEATKEGPWKWANKAHHQGKFGGSVGGRTRMVRTLMFEPVEQSVHEDTAKKHHHHSHHHSSGTGSGSGTGNTGGGSGTSGSGSGTTGSGSGGTTGSGSGTGSGTGSGSGTGTGTGTGTTPTTQAGEVTATDIQNDSEYLCPVTIGTPGQTFMLDFDTGSADLWVWSTELPSATISSSGSGHTIYNPSDSSTYQAVSGDSWNISYGDGSSASGTVGTDNVTIGGLLIKNQAVELANNLSSEFASGAGDGLLGLAWGSINTVTPTPVQTPVENMISQQDIPSTAELFTAHLGSWRDASDPDKGISFYTFGYIDQDVLSTAGVTEDQIFYTPVDNSQGFWMFNSTSASVNGTSIALSSNTAIADTGTTLALVSDSVVEAIYNAIPGSTYDSSQQGYTFPSSTTADQLPVVQFDVGGQLFTVNKEDLSFADAGNGMVYGGIQSRGSNPFDILGDTFLKSVYAIFDQGNTRFGAVQRTEPTQNLAVPPTTS